MIVERHADRLLCELLSCIRRVGPAKRQPVVLVRGVVVREVERVAAASGYQKGVKISMDVELREV
jgi:hypothetical protein